MNWPRIKTLFIVLFLITNIVLLHEYINESKSFDTSNSPDLKNIIKIYNAKNINIDIAKDKIFTEIPAKLRSYDISYLSFDPAIVKQLFGDGAKLVGSVFSNGKENIVINNTEFLLSSDIKPVELYEVIASFNDMPPKTDNELFDKYTNDFQNHIQSLGFQFDIHDGEIKSYSGFDVLSLYQLIDGYLCEECKIFALFKDGKIKGIYLNFITSDTINPYKTYDIIDIGFALFSVYPNVKADDVLENIEIVYKLNDTDLFDQEFIKGEILPYIKFSFKKQPDILIRATR